MQCQIAQIALWGNDTTPWCEFNRAGFVTAMVHNLWVKMVLVRSVTGWSLCHPSMSLCSAAGVSAEDAVIICKLCSVFCCFMIFFSLSKHFNYLEIVSKVCPIFTHRRWISQICRSHEYQSHVTDSFYSMQPLSCSSPRHTA